MRGMEIDRERWWDEGGGQMAGWRQMQQSGQERLRQNEKQ